MASLLSGTTQPMLLDQEDHDDHSSDDEMNDDCMETTTTSTVLHGDRFLREESVDDLEKLLAEFIVLQGGDDTNCSIDKIMAQQGVQKCEEPRIRAPGIYWLFGKTMSGKTDVLKNILSNTHLIDFTVRDKHDVKSFKNVEVEEVIYFYTSMWQNHPFDELEKEGVKFRREIPTNTIIEHLCHDKKPRIIVLDDMIQHVVEDDSLFQLLSRQVHHLNIMVLVTSQILHPRGKNAVSLISQGHGYFFFQFTTNKEGLKKRLRDLLTDNTNLKKVLAFYEESIKRKGGYLFVNAHQLHERSACPFRFFSCLFPEEGITKALDLR